MLRGEELWRNGGRFDKTLRSLGGRGRNLSAWNLRRFQQNSSRFYHGTIDDFIIGIRAHGIDLSRGRPNLDFGQGFYVTQTRQHAIKRANSMVELAMEGLLDGASSTAKAEVLVFRVGDSSFRRMDGLMFRNANESWKAFVLGNRNGALKALNVDYIQGPVLKNIKKGTAWPFPDYNQTTLLSRRIVIIFQQGLR